MSDLPFVLDFPNGQRIEDILKKAQNLANVQTIGAGLHLDEETGELTAPGVFEPTDTQLAAMNSGIDSALVSQITTNAGDIVVLQEAVGYAISELEGVL